MLDEDTHSLVTAAQAGDRDALERLVKRYLPIVTKMIRARVRGIDGLGHDADDLVQTALTRAFSSLEGFEWRGEGSFRYWIGTIATRSVIDLQRRQGRGPRVDEVGLAEALAAAESDGPSASAVAMRGESNEALNAALGMLADLDREVILMRAVCEMSFEEVARHAKLKNAASARAAYSRALARLSSKLRKERQ